MDGLRAGQYGASHRFRVIREEREKRPERSEHNPDGIEERTIKRLVCSSSGPSRSPRTRGRRRVSGA